LHVPFLWQLPEQQSLFLEHCSFHAEQDDPIGAGVKGGCVVGGATGAGVLGTTGAGVVGVLE